MDSQNSQHSETLPLPSTSTLLSPASSPETLLQSSGNLKQLNEYDQWWRNYRDILDKVSHLSKDVKRDVPVPSIVVIGDQSTGKSSLLSKMFEIELPQSHKTCTMCPVTIYAGSDVNEVNGKPVDPKDFPKEIADLNNTLTDYSEIPIVVSSKIGPPLVVIDLPGLVPGAEETKRTKVSQIAEKYVNDPNALILFVSKLSADGENETQAAYQLVSQADPDNKRTLSVFTKCDRDTDQKSTVPTFMKSISLDNPLSPHLTAARDREEQISHEKEVQVLSKYPCDASFKGTRLLVKRLQTLLIRLVMQTRNSTLDKISETEAKLGKQLDLIGKEPRSVYLLWKSIKTQFLESLSKIKFQEEQTQLAFDLKIQTIGGIPENVQSLLDHNRFNAEKKRIEMDWLKQQSTRLDKDTCYENPFYSSQKLFNMGWKVIQADWKQSLTSHKIASLQN